MTRMGARIAGLTTGAGGVVLLLGLLKALGGRELRLESELFVGKRGLEVLLGFAEIG